MRSRDVIQFIILQRPRRAATSEPGPSTSAAANTRIHTWGVPNTQEFHDLMTRVECVIVEEDRSCFKVLKWTNLWGKVGQIGLSAKVGSHLEEFRDIVERDGGPDSELMCTIFPRKGLDKRGTVSILLKEMLCKYNALLLPK